ncbi:hypothetical protein WMF38_20780 [Sorangium sp. So ce118]
MLVKFGKHASKEVGWVLLNQPHYLEYARAEATPGKAMSEFISNADACIAHFDKLPLRASCAGKQAGKRCPNAASRATAYASHSGLGADLYWWCNSCDPSQSGAERGNLQQVRTYRDVLGVARVHSSRKGDAAFLLKQLAHAKLDPASKALTKAHLETLFGP